MFELIQTPPFLIPFVAILGGIFGSFANVVIYRMPEGKSVVWPGSHCPKCGTKIRWFQNIPMISWLMLRGRCGSCKKGIPFRYFLVEFLMAALFGLAAGIFGWSVQLIEALPFIFGLVTCSFIDLDHYLLPDKFTLSGVVIGLVGATLNPHRSFMEALIGVLIGGGFLWLIAYAYFAVRGKDGLGGGDIKLLAWVGAVLGWQSIPFVVLFASLTGAVIGVIVAARSKDGFSKPIPFGPFLATGALLYLFRVGSHLTQLYFEFHGLEF